MLAFNISITLDASDRGGKAEEKNSIYINAVENRRIRDFTSGNAMMS